MKERQINYVIYFINALDVLYRFLEIKLAEYGTNPIRFATMKAITGHGGQMIPTAISKWTYRSPRTVTSMLDRLESDGLIERKQNVNDRRSVIAVVTDKGWIKTEEMRIVGDQLSETALSVLTENEIETLHQILGKLAKHLLSEVVNERRKLKNR